ncbi:universal stress protein [Kitasatospora sp. NPDC093806]|uniref:universal stress protein n=1 Tax=Kitasatospora sp. NPDC093806 TaxID=3155075 RepID=UPI00342F6B17
MPEQPDGRIVVGVDGSPLSRAAVRWAARLAALTGGPLEAVSVWEFPALFDPTGLVPPPLDGFAAERRAAAILDETLAAVLSPATAVRRRLPAGRPGPALVAAAAGARALVIGSRGRSAPPGAPLGTVALHCVDHAPCTVLLVRE